MSTPQRLPNVNGDVGQWGYILNQFIDLQHYNTGSDNAANGGHQTVTIRPGTTAAGTAPLTLMSGSLLSTPEAGAIEFLNNQLYFTQTTSTIRRTIGAFDDSSGAAGDIYYRDSGGSLLRLAVGSDNQILTASSGAPSWQSVGGSVNNMDGGNASSLFGGSATVDGGSA